MMTPKQEEHFLLYACRDGDFHTVVRLLTANPTINVNVTDNLGYSGLWWACRVTKDEEQKI